MQGSFSPIEDPGFGVRCVAWHPTGAYLAVGGWDDKVGQNPCGTRVALRAHGQIYILDNLTWKPVTVFGFQARVPPNVVSKHREEAHSGFNLAHRACGENPLAGWKRLMAGGSFPVGAGFFLSPFI